MSGCTVGVYGVLASCHSLEFSAWASLCSWVPPRLDEAQDCKYLLLGELSPKRRHFQVVWGKSHALPNHIGAIQDYLKECPSG